MFEIHFSSSAQKRLWCSIFQFSKQKKSFSDSQESKLIKILSSILQKPSSPICASCRCCLCLESKFKSFYEQMFFRTKKMRTIMTSATLLCQRFQAMVVFVVDESIQAYLKLQWEWSSQFFLLTMTISYQ